MSLLKLKLKFSKSWKNANDFPTVEVDEAKVRADMQQLHDETKDAFNALIDALENEGLDDTIRVDESAEKPIRYLRMLNNHSLQVSYDGKTWISTLGPESTVYEHHVAEHKTGGSDALTPGDIGAYSKQDVLTEATAAKYGLSATATPDAVLSALGEYKLHRWEKTTNIYKGVVDILGQQEYIMRDAEEHDYVLFEYGTSYHLDVYGNVYLDNPETLRADVLNIEGLVPHHLAGKYGYIHEGTIDASQLFYFGLNPDATINRKVINEVRDETDKVIDREYAYDVMLYDFAEVNVDRTTETVTVTSGDPDAYPKNGMEVDNTDPQNPIRYDYRYLGVPLEKAGDAVQTAEMEEAVSDLRTELRNYTNQVMANSGVKMAVGTYTGNGSYGADTPNTLAFDFKPELVILIRDGYYQSSFAEQLVLMRGQTAFPNYARGETGIVWNNAGLSWWSTSAGAAQYNANGTTYRYFAIGR